VLNVNRENIPAWRKPGDIPPPSIAEVSEFLAPWLRGRRVRALELLSGGLINRNCLLHIDDARDVVLRLYDRDPSAAAKEHAVLDRLRGHLPVPAVLHADGHALVLERMDGVPFISLIHSGDTDAIAACAFDAGRLLARLQQYRFTATGLLTNTLDVDTTGLPDPITTASLVEHFGRSPAFASRAGARRLDALLAIARDWDEHPTAPPLTPTLVHADFNWRNLLIHRDGRRSRVTAILDWEFAFAGPAYVDVGNFLRHEPADRPRLEPWFSRGMREGGFGLEGDWRRAARMADLPALCELISRESTPEDVAAEIVELVSFMCRGARS
jgi:aminoglycoside phosphotransferase (APT) family kinase protein